MNHSRATQAITASIYWSLTWLKNNAVWWIPNAWSSLSERPEKHFCRINGTLKHEIDCTLSGAFQSEDKFSSDQDFLRVADERVLSRLILYNRDNDSEYAGKYGVDGIRTHDLRLYMSMLLPLSYTHSLYILYSICIYSLCW
jgi:hypothetical protein